MRLPPRTSPILDSNREYIDRADQARRDRWNHVGYIPSEPRPIVDIRRRPSRVRAFCSWLRDAGRWLNYGWGPAYAISRDERPAPAWMWAVLFGVLAIGWLVVRLVFGIPSI